MSPEIMGFQMDPDYLSRFIHNLSSGRIGYRKYPLIRSNPFPGYVFLEAVRNLLRDKDNFPLLAALGGSESELSILNITRCQIQDLADPHPAPGHQLKHEPISGFDGAEDDFIHYFLFQDGPADGGRGVDTVFSTWGYHRGFGNWDRGFG